MASFPQPNYANPHTRVAAVTGMAIVGLVIMIPFVVARLYVRRSRRIFWIDDWLIVAAAVRLLCARHVDTLNVLARSPASFPRG
jgi:hypothetical protein